jgi:hypothetical protein
LAEIDARAARRIAQQIDDVLPDARLARVVQAGEELRQLRIGCEASDEVIRQSCDRIVPAKALIQRGPVG